MPLKRAWMVGVGLSVAACGGETSERAPRLDAGATTPDAAPSERDAGGVCHDDERTPGNDCPDAVGCRGEAACALEGASCCVPGFAVEDVVCEPSPTCTAGARAGCDGPEDCDGRSCCVDIGTGTTSCGDSCSGSVVCHESGDCPAGTECVQGSVFTWWGFCM